MTNFVARANFTTCQTEWVEKGEEYDYHQEVARSGYGDMLHDKERNEMYEIALLRAIRDMHDSGRTAEVLDIGTGTGLLSMMAVKHGADRVVACEAFVPVAECAELVLEANGMKDKITLIKNVSHSLTAEEIGGRVNILVAEVFDTELIGEGALETFKHALEELLEEDSIVIPQSAVIIAQPVFCPFFRSWNNFRDICLEDHGATNPDNHDRCVERVRPPPSCLECPGLPSVHDVQLDSLGLDRFTAMSDPQIVLRFDLNGNAGDLKFSDVKHVRFVARCDGEVDCVFMWWELTMDREADYILSTAPYWAHPQGARKQWRDHWLQAVYYPVHKIVVKREETFGVIALHDEYSFWFDLCKTTPSADLLDRMVKEIMHCSCGLHLGCSRSRLALMNDHKRNQIYVKALKKAINSESICLSFSDNSILPIMAAKLGAKKVFVVQPQSTTSFTIDFAKYNNVDGKVKVFNSPFSKLVFEDFDGEVINTIIGEPFLSSSKLPWEDVRFLYAKDELAKLFKTQKGPQELPLMIKSPTVLPKLATIKGVAVEFKDLNKVKGRPIGLCQGFDLTPFDDMVYHSSQLADSCLESHPLWEYPARALTPEFELLQVNFTVPFVNSVRQQERVGSVDFNGSGKCNGIVMWVNYNFDENARDMTINNGPISPILPNQPIQWDPRAKQGVFFLNSFEPVDAEGCRLKFKASFNFRSAEMVFDFGILDCFVNVVI